MTDIPSIEAQMKAAKRHPGSKNRRRRSPLWDNPRALVEQMKSTFREQKQKGADDVNGLHTAFKESNEHSLGKENAEALKAKIGDEDDDPLVTKAILVTKGRLMLLKMSQKTKAYANDPDMFPIYIRIATYAYILGSYLVTHLGRSLDNQDHASETNFKKVMLGVENSTHMSDLEKQSRAFRTYEKIESMNPNQLFQNIDDNRQSIERLFGRIKRQLSNQLQPLGLQLKPSLNQTPNRRSNRDQEMTEEFISDLLKKTEYTVFVLQYEYRKVYPKRLEEIDINTKKRGRPVEARDPENEFNENDLVDTSTFGKSIPMMQQHPHLKRLAVSRTIEHLILKEIAPFFDILVHLEERSSDWLENLIINGKTGTSDVFDDAVQERIVQSGDPNQMHAEFERVIIEKLTA